jgi:hypothetical protein
MEDLASITISEERLEDCREVIEPELQDLIRSALKTGFSREEILVAVSEPVAEDFVAMIKTPSVR